MCGQPKSFVHYLLLNLWKWLIMLPLQIDMFSSNVASRLEVLNGWYLMPSATSTAEFQRIIFDVSGAISNYHLGHKSEWIINGIEGCVFYSSGDPCRVPTRDVVELASQILINLTISGSLFPESLEKVLYGNAWAKGYEAGFNGAPNGSNPYRAGTSQFNAWIDGWNGGV